MTEEQKRHNDDVIISELRSLREVISLEIYYLKKNVEELKKQNEDSNKRINVIELWQSNSMGRIAVIFTIIGIGASLLVAWVSKHF